GVEGWNLLADELNDGESYSGKKFTLEGNLEVTTMLGMNGTGFAGTFYGNGKTLTVNYDSDLEYSAPFVYVNGGTIKDLTVSGTITAGGQYVGGIVGQSSGETTIEACNFVGKLLTTNASVTIGGGFVAENNGTLTISNSLYAPATIETGENEPSAEGTATFLRNTEGHTSDITNSYYTLPLGTAQGKHGYTVTADEGITVALAENSTNGLTYDGTIYAGSGETVSLAISGGDTPENGYTFKGYKASAGMLTQSGEAYSLTMPAGNVTISAEFVENISYKDANGQDATASDYTVLTSSMTNLTAGTYVVKENVTVSALTLAGDVNLILCDGATLSVEGEVNGANSLVIYGQTNGTGKLTATNITLTDNKNLSVYGGTLTVGTISVAGTVTVKNATVNNEAYDANGDSTTSYTVTFDSKGGSAVASQTLKFKYGETVKATKPAAPTRANYDFVEWQLNGTAYDFNTAVTGNITLTAKWTATEYTITYNGTDGATFTTANPTKYTVETATFTLTNPTKNGYTFKGWTGTGITGTSETVTITKGSTGDRTYTATWTPKGGKSQEDDPSRPTFRSHSLILEGEIGVNFYMNLPSLSGVDYDDHDKCYMEFDINGDKSNALKYKDANISYTENGKTYYGFRCYISSVQMAETITAVLHYGDNLTVSQDYSVQEYLDAILDGDFSGAAKDLMIAIQNYGYYAQQMLSKANNWTIGDKYAAIERASQSDYDATEIARARENTAQYAISRDVGSSQIQEVQYSLLLDSKTTINLYLEVKEGYTGTVTATLDGGTANVATKLSSKEYLVQIRNIPAHELSTIHTIQVTAGDSFTVKVAALSYVYTVLNSTAEKIGGVDIATMRNGVTALYEYYDSAMTYAGRN
ncbi:MAG: InlB B-repeat-containing protein, partial [Synergistaceae bacterium]|nr:InlB B-repeat-containing protein [Synergistaceae bacterium]